MRIAIYIRVSTQEQAVKGYSVEEQQERSIKYCEAMGWATYKVYTDAGYSGANTDRPALQKMIKDIEAGKIDKVLVYKLDRLSRSQLDTLYLIEKVFIHNGADFVSMSENFDTATPFGRAMIGILAVFAQLEREQIKERMAMGREARAKQGKFHGSSQVPIGYDYKDGQLVVNEFEAMQVKKVFEMYAAGKGTPKIAEELNAAGLNHRYGKWIASTVRVVLMNQTYIGNINHNGKVYKGEHEAIIDEPLFDKVASVQAIKTEEHKKHRRRSGLASSYLGGYIYCGRCGAKYSKRTDNPSTNWRAERYKCYSRSKANIALVKDPNCLNKNWNMEELDNLIFDEIKKLAIDPDSITSIKASKKIDDNTPIMQAEIEKLDSQISRLMDLYTVGDLPLELLQDKIHNLNGQKKKLEKQIEDIQVENEETLSHEKAFELVQSFSDVLDRGDFEEIRTTIGALIEKITIDGDDVTIHWRFA